MCHDMYENLAISQYSINSAVPHCMLLFYFWSKRKKSESNTKSEQSYVI